ncbi:MAG: pectinacetylesterase family protein [Myxococcales bacterium]|nr:pectinacetylesterase family protein [Myxococcales bacterium]MDH3482786.1 pectinacetylesterase family protein [Myxococcales bacterium]
MKNPWFLGCGLVLGLCVAGCGTDSSADGTGGSGATGGVGGAGGSFEPPVRGEWVKYEPPGAICSDGSPYAFYVEFSETNSENVIFYFMGGGACWDFESCSPGSGIRGAANPNGLPDDYANAHMNLGGLAINVNQVYPLLNQDPAVSPMADWNKVFVPYCTGDVYMGTTTITYEDPNGVELDNEFHHVGHLNVLAMIDMLNGMFSKVSKLFVGGCSAGGVGAIGNYYFLRTGLNGVEQGYLLDDSGPVYPSGADEPTSRSRRLYERIRLSWDVDRVIESAPSFDQLTDDFGALSRVLADEFPNDRLAATHFRLDYNIALFSYERFYTLDAGGAIVPFDFDGEVGLDENVAAARTAIHTLWWDDTALLVNQYDSRDNLGYFIPFWRQTNSSHCVTIPGLEENPLGDLLVDFAGLAWDGTEIDTDEGEMTIHDYAIHLLSDEPLQSHFEETGEGPFVPCTPGADFDEVACEAAVNP